MKGYYKYISFRNIPILIEKLIIPANEAYFINHSPNNKKANFFLETTDTNNYKIYSKENIKQIIREIKHQSSVDKIYFQNNTFKLDIEKWVRTVFNILAEYIQFDLKINPIYYVCKNCLYPIIFLDKRNILSYMEIILKKLDKKIKEEINIINCLINLITPSYFKDDSLPEINVLYYTEDNEDSLEKSCELFIQKISGCFILSKTLEELKIILKEIYSEFLKDDKIKFQLILSGNTCEKITKFILDNNYMIMFDQICIYSSEENYNFDFESIKIIYQSFDKDIDIYQNAEDIIEIFFQYICTVNKTNCYKYTKVINYIEYLDIYYKFHEKISLHYGNVSYLTFNNNIGIIQDFVNSIEEKNLKIKTSYGDDKKKALIETLLVFENVATQRIENFKDVIFVYTKDNYSFYQDLNNWLRELDSLAYDKIGYFVADFMFCLNKYGEFKNTGIKETTTLYRGIKINFIDLLLYQRNKGKIITFPSFVSSSLDLKIAEDLSDRNTETAEERKKTGLFSVIFTINYKINKNNNYDKYYPVCFNISEISRFDEKEVLFQPFTFFKIKKVDINLNEYIADISLSAIKKLDLLEPYIKDKFKLKYNEKYNIVEIPKKSLFTLINLNENYNSDESEHEIENQNSKKKSSNIKATQIKVNNFLDNDKNIFQNKKRIEKKSEKEKKNPIINKCQILIKINMILSENEDDKKKDYNVYESENDIFIIFGKEFVENNKKK